jgi:pimeloyl-ACP methyl ester carboxylesterase
MKTSENVIGRRATVRSRVARERSRVAEPLGGRLRMYRSEEGFHAITAWYEDVLASFEEPVESVYVDTRFGRTHLLAAGPPDAEPLLLVHGVAGCAPLWRRRFPALSRHYRVDWSLGIYDEATRRVNKWQGLRVLGKFFRSEPKSLLRRFAVPGLLVFGEHEVLYDPRRVGVRAERLMPGLRVEVVRGAGHAAVYDKPDEVNETPIEFLGRSA